LVSHYVFPYSLPHPQPLSFPTRRSSDLTSFRGSGAPPVPSPAWPQSPSPPASPPGAPTAGRPPPAPTATPPASGRSTSSFPSTTDRKSTRLNSSHLGISYAVFCWKKKNI